MSNNFESELVSINRFELERLRELANIHLRINGEEVWHWQGDGYDFPESLTCPVVMKADTLRTLLESKKIPEGHIIVPIKPTDEMVTAGSHASPQPMVHCSAYGEGSWMESVPWETLDPQTRKTWDAMIAQAQYVEALNAPVTTVSRDGGPWNWLSDNTINVFADSLDWLDAALNCNRFVWDADQHEAAMNTYLAGVELLKVMKMNKTDKTDE